MFLTIEVGALAVLHDLVEIALQHVRQLVDLGPQSSRRAARSLERLPQFVDQLARERGEIVDEVQRVLDLVRDAGGELAERGELFGLDQPVLRGLQVLERARQLVGPMLHLLEQPGVLDGDHRLVGEGLGQARSAFARMGPTTLRSNEHADDLPIPAEAARREGADAALPCDSRKVNSGSASKSAT